MIEEDEGADHLALAVRQRPAHLEAIAEVAGTRHDHQFQRVAGLGIAQHGIIGGKPAHEVSVIFADIITAIVGRRPSAETLSSSRRTPEPIASGAVIKRHHVIASEAKQSRAAKSVWIASSLALLAMTAVST